MRRPKGPAFLPYSGCKLIGVLAWEALLHSQLGAAGPGHAAATEICVQATLYSAGLCFLFARPHVTFPRAPGADRRHEAGFAVWNWFRSVSSEVQAPETRLR